MLTQPDFSPISGRFQHLDADETLQAVYCYQDFTFAVSDLAKWGERGRRTQGFCSGFVWFDWILWWLYGILWWFYRNWLDFIVVLWDFVVVLWDLMGFDGGFTGLYGGSMRLYDGFMVIQGIQIVLVSRIYMNLYFLVDSYGYGNNILLYSKSSMGYFP